jgi:type 1 glutamine amidotransferase
MSFQFFPATFNFSITVNFTNQTLNNMKKKSSIRKIQLIMFYSLVALLGVSFARKQPKILIFSLTKGYHHQSIAKGISAIQQLGKENNFLVDTTTNAALFTSKNLKQYKAVVFLSTSGDVLNQEQEEAFKNYIESGGGYVGIHAATDTEYDWPWYNELVGAYFKSHPKPQEAVLKVNDTNFIATKHLPAEWKRFDEWYNFKSTHFDKVTIILSIDEKSYTGGENGDNHPMSWYHSVGKGRAFYTALGHTDESYAEPLFLQHILGGIEYAMTK